MSDIQRYVLLGGYDPRVVDEGPWVTYAAHVAAVAAARAEEQELRIADASNGIGHWIDCPTERHDVTAIYRAGLADGVKAARKAVAALSSGIKGEGIPKTVYQYRNDAGDVAGAGEAMSRTTTRPERHYRMESVMEPGVGYCRECLQPWPCLYEQGRSDARDAGISLRSGSWGTDYDGVQIDMADALAAIDALEEDK